MSTLDELGNDFKNFDVYRIGKVKRPQIFRNLFKGFVVNQNGAEQGLFGFKVLRQNSRINIIIHQ